jgi:hypothetical protein
LCGELPDSAFVAVLTTPASKSIDEAAFRWCAGGVDSRKADHTAFTLESVALVCSLKLVTVVQEESKAHGDYDIRFQSIRKGALPSFEYYQQQ